LSFSAVPVPTNESVRVTTISYRTNYELTKQINLYVVLSDNRVAFLDVPRLDNTWLAAAGMTYQATQHFSLSLDDSYSHFLSALPGNNFTQNLVSLGAHCQF
jgi:hypothetical protein